MKAAEFETQIQRLVSTYGKAQYSEERVKIIWREVQSLSEADFSNIIEKMISECRQAPLIQEIKDYSAQAKIVQFNKKSNHTLSGQGGCSTCKGTGTVLVRRLDDLTPWAFRCDCEAAKLRNFKYPQWANAHKSAYKYV